MLLLLGKLQKFNKKKKNRNGRIFLSEYKQSIKLWFRELSLNAALSRNADRTEDEEYW